jgi:hypothetical protein
VLFFPMDDPSQTIRQMERFRHDLAPEFMTGGKHADEPSR